MKHPAPSVSEATPTQLRVPQLYELVAERLKQSIQDGSYPPGSRLPAERDLATTLGVGRATVREAMGELVNQGVVQTKPNSGSFVRDTALEVMRSLKTTAAQADTSPLSTLAARLAIEPLIAQFAAAVGGRDSDIEGLLDHMENTSDLTEPAQRRAWNEADRQFHHRIALMTGNPVMVGIAQVVAAAVDEPLWRQLRDHGIHDAARARLYVYEHRLIYEAIATGNQEAAGFYVRQHLERVQKDMLTA
ncbi:DNA-binding transcriptional regulator, FadR family [Rhodoferax sp. OV413]|uniref:FadR/GntR family transcriptional regulator n=1 Tax=Rhodoferax sp. OV413 TaxID=1855285 RepID=UPI000889A0E2|nr:FadR/GntR family transcriptional regulator [Rhodoferax sp. OV413]SDO43462.1 DNA-binding transcriptional regulator, FadR family [Rhodoferax sp. OV413]